VNLSKLLKETKLNYEPLVEALSKGEAVVYVGAGASAPSGLPLWRDFLAEFLEFARNRLTLQDWMRANKFLTDGDFLLAAEILQRGLPQRTFAKYIQDVLVGVSKPNDVHKSIARLPFSLAITTNFDTLLEDTYDNTECYTWQDTNEVFEAIRSKKFAVVKLHGSVRRSSQSLRLTRTDFRDIASSANSELNECLKTLLTWKTFLFVGHSLRDSDLLRLMDEARIRFGKKFGPHYAILPRSEVDGTFREYLKDVLSIECIPYDVDESDTRSHERNIVDILKSIAGKVAKLELQTNGAGMSDFSIPRAEAAQSVLKDSVRLTGSIRGEVCMIESDVNPELVREAIVASHKKPRSGLPELNPDSVIHTAFLQGNALDKQDYIYLANTLAADMELPRAGYLNARYLTCDPSVRSELAYPIVADGRRVGVLNLESDLEDAYTPDHIEVTGKIAKQLGQIYLQSEWRRRASAPLGDYYQQPDRFEGLLRNSRLIKTMNHDFLLYEIDYEKKRLVAHHTGDYRPFDWSFDQPSLARQIFQEHRDIYVPDATTEVNAKGPHRKTQLNRLGLDRYGITGPVFACPIRVSGQTEAVLVTWMKPETDPDSKDRPKEKVEQWFQSSSGQVFRLANLLANDIYGPEPSRAIGFINTFYPSLEKIDDVKIWTRSKLNDPDFRDQIMYALMGGLLNESCGFRCVRIWQTSRVSNLTHEGDTAISPSERFECVGSLTREDSTAPGKESRGAYRGSIASEGDPYCRYTIARYHRDPFARWQHPKMFGQPDNNARSLDKDLSGPWIVAPIVRPSKTGGNSELLGFISADSHDRSSGTPVYQPELDTRVIALQCRIMDLIAELARHVLAIAVPRSPAPSTR
jgi:NAD-dependent SIR2 family protein deacetylase